MSKQTKLEWVQAGLLLLSFVFLTLAVRTSDVQPWIEGTTIGLGSVNIRVFEALGGFHQVLYDLTEIGVYPAILSALCFGFLGLYQWIERKNLFKVDPDLFILGGFYLLIVAAYVIFEIVVINYRPVLIDGSMAASYPSSHTMSIVAAMTVMILQAKERLSNPRLIMGVTIALSVYMVLFVVGRFLSGAHWFSDIVAGVLLASALVKIYVAAIATLEEKQQG